MFRVLPESSLRPAQGEVKDFLVVLRNNDDAPWEHSRRFSDHYKSDDAAPSNRVPSTKIKQHHPLRNLAAPTVPIAKAATFLTAADHAKKEPPGGLGENGTKQGVIISTQNRYHKAKDFKASWTKHPPKG